MQQNEIIIPKEHKKEIRRFLKDASTRMTNTNTAPRECTRIIYCSRGVIFLPKFPGYSNSLKKGIRYIVTNEELKNCIHENEVKQLIEESIIKQYNDKKKRDQTDVLIEEIYNTVRRNLVYILPNHILHFSGGIESIRFSSTIECVRTESIKNKYADHIPNIQNLNFIVDKRYPLPPPDFKL